MPAAKGPDSPVGPAPARQLPDTAKPVGPIQASIATPSASAPASKPKRARKAIVAAALIAVLAGGGWYDRRDSYFQHAVVNGILCGFYFCFRGPLAVSLKVGEASTGLKFEENAGAGFEFALDPGTSFFVDARYMRFEESGRRQAFIPVRIGLRF